MVSWMLIVGSLVSGPCIGDSPRLDAVIVVGGET
jgi:hypothetical protein